MNDSILKRERLRVNEIFHSLQGEADAVGYPTVFVRLTGCPLRCQYCDTEYAFHAGDWYDLDAIVDQVRSFGARLHYEIRGSGPPLLVIGSPMASADFASLADALAGDDADLPIVQAVIALAHGLGIDVTAEGIETPTQQAHLTRLGCQRGQGYLFSKPVPNTECDELLRLDAALYLRSAA